MKRLMLFASLFLSFVAQAQSKPLYDFCRVNAHNEAIKRFNQSLAPRALALARKSHHENVEALEVVQKSFFEEEKKQIAMISLMQNPEEYFAHELKDNTKGLFKTLNAFKNNVKDYGRWSDIVFEDGAIILMVCKADTIADEENACRVYSNANEEFYLDRKNHKAGCWNDHHIFKIENCESLKISSVPSKEDNKILTPKFEIIGREFQDSLNPNEFKDQRFCVNGYCDVDILGPTVDGIDLKRIASANEYALGESLRVCEHLKPKNEIKAEMSDENRISNAEKSSGETVPAKQEKSGHSK